MLLTILRLWSWCCSYILCRFVVYTTDASCFKVFPCSLSSCFFSLFSIVITSLWEEGAGLYASRAFVCLFCSYFLSFFSSSWCRGWLRWLWYSLDLPINIYRYNMDLVYINAYTKFYQNPSICSEDIEGKHSVSRAITLLFINEFSSFAIPNHSSLISMSKQSWKKICQKLPELRVRKRSADGRTDTQTVLKVQHNTPPLLMWQDIKIHLTKKKEKEWSFWAIHVPYIIPCIRYTLYM